MTYVVDAQGTVRHIIDAPRDFALHAEESLAQAQALTQTPTQTPTVDNS